MLVFKTQESRASVAVDVLLVAGGCYEKGRREVMRRKTEVMQRLLLLRLTIMCCVRHIMLIKRCQSMITVVCLVRCGCVTDNLQLSLSIKNVSHLCQFYVYFSLTQLQFTLSADIYY